MNDPASLEFSRKAMAVAVASVLLPATTQAAVGRVDFAYGDVLGVSEGGEQRRLTRGAEINEGDTIITNRGRAQLRFSDGARTSLLPNSEFRVDKYDYVEEKEEESTGFFSLLKGGLRTITGAIGQLRKEAYQVTTPSATIGIRGTEYLVVLGNSASLWVADGEIEACNEGGCTNFEGGESGFVADSNSKPIHTDQKPDTSGGDVETNEYSAAEDVNESGTPDVVQSDTSPPFPNGAFYALAVSVGDSAEAAVGAAALVDATFGNAGTTLASYSSSGLNGSIGTASLLDTGRDGGTIGWGRWVEGDITVAGSLSTTCCFPGAPQTLSGSESHHYVVGVPTADMPASGSASYSLLGHTTPTYGDGTATGTLDSASMTADFGTGTVGIDMQVTIGVGPSFNTYWTSASASISGSRFTASGFDTTDSFTSSSFNTLIEGFFAGDAASRAGYAYHIETSRQINGAVTFSKD